MHSDGPVQEEESSKTVATVDERIVEAAPPPSSLHQYKPARHCAGCLDALRRHLSPRAFCGNSEAESSLLVLFDESYVQLRQSHSLHRFQSAPEP